MIDLPRAEHPRPDLKRKNWLNLNGAWDFRLFPLSEDESERCFDRNSYNESITVPFSWAAPASGIGRDVPGTGWYRRSAIFNYTDRLFIIIGGCDYEAEMYINGTLIAAHTGGYTPFEAEITGVFVSGKNNVIEIRARDIAAKSQLYGKQGYGSIAGIWQTVYLEERPIEYIKDFKIKTKLDGTVSVNVRADAADGGILRLTSGNITTETIIKNDSAYAELIMPAPKLWSPDSPTLYPLTLALNTGDEVESYFGIREIGTITKDDYSLISLNGKPIYINATLDQAFNPEGYFTYTSYREIKNEAFRLKRLGLNAVRIHIKCEEPLKLYQMDKQGIMVIADVPNFWGEPDSEARAGYEQAWPEYFKRDFNHPSIFMWVMFNESWGLLSGSDKQYLADTQNWVRSVYERAKLYDDTRLIEDNSPCRYDHVKTDVNSWHFYIHGYEHVKAHVREVAGKTSPGSGFNYAKGCLQTGAPLMNSECGMVWGVEGNAGDSDIAWQYHYMLNEFRLNPKICGFVFTEFHDVPNEFNGYYRIDNSDKDFGYGYFCRGMRVNDLHAPIFLAVDFPPCIKIAGGARADIPLAISRFGGNDFDMCIDWELWHDGIDGKTTDCCGTRYIGKCAQGLTELKPLRLTMPNERSVEILSLYLKDTDGNVLMRNFTTFFVQGEAKNSIEIPIEDGKTEGFEAVHFAQDGLKLDMCGRGSVTYLQSLEGLRPNRLRLVFEAGSKRLLTKDKGCASPAAVDGDYMLGYRVDRGAIKSSYIMTDETRFKSNIAVSINGVKIAEDTLENDWADARGILSWLNQEDGPRPLDEAGSYGELKLMEIPSRLMSKIADEDKVIIKIEADNGLALYSSRSGKYAVGLELLYD